MKITGAVLRESGLPRPYALSRPIEVTDLELDAPGPGEVLVRIEAAGLCHSDLSVVDGNRPRPLPMLLGHESAGIVEVLGDGVDDLEVGQRVVTVFLPRCGDCAECRTDGKLPCAAGTTTNTAGVLPSGAVRLHELAGTGEGSTSTDTSASTTPVNHHLGVSGFATHAVVDRRSVVPVAATTPPHVAAMLGCAVLTGGGAVKNAGGLQPGQDVIVVGLGGVGMAAVLTAIAITRAAGGRVIGVDSLDAKLDAARDLGADAALSPAEAVAAGLTAPVVVEAAGHPRAFETAVSLTAAGGVTVTAGLPAPNATSTISPLVLTAEARTIVGCYLGSAVPSRDIPEYERMWREGLLPVGRLASAVIGLGAINIALDTLADGRAIRQIIDFSAATPPA